MKKLWALMMLLAMILTCGAAAAEYPFLMPTPSVPLELRPSADEVKVYAQPDVSSAITGYIIVGGRQQVEVLYDLTDWYYVSFTSIYGTSYGYIPASRFQVVATPTPVPTPTPTAAPQIITPTPQPQLRPADEEVRVYAQPNRNANLVGYIIPGSQQQVSIITRSAGWYYVSFTSVYGLSYGWIPAECFGPVATPSPVPATTPSVQGNTTAFVVNTQYGYRLNLRQSASASSPSLGKYYTGTPVILTGRVSGSFAEVRIGTQSGWMDRAFLSDDPYGFVSELPEAVIANGDSGANLRSGPSTSTSRLGSYPDGATVLVLGVRSDGWYHVVLGGQTGYISAALVTPSFSWQYGQDSDNPAVSQNLTAGSTRLYVTAGSLHLRQSASTGAPSMGLFHIGTPVVALSYTRTGWAYVRIGESEGYMDMNYLAAAAPSRLGVTRVIRNPYGTGLNLRTAPDTGANIIMLCPNETLVTVLGDLKDGWCYVAVGSQTGYMMGARLTTP